MQLFIIETNDVCAASHTGMCRRKAESKEREVGKMLNVIMTYLYDLAVGLTSS